MAAEMNKLVDIAKDVLDEDTVKLMEERALVAYEQKYGSSY